MILFIIKFLFLVIGIFSMDACTVMKREKRHNASGILNEGMQFLAMACSGNTFASFCSHPIHSVTLDSVPEITTLVNHTHASLVGTQLNVFLTTPTLPVNVSTRHAVEAHQQSPYSFCDT